MAMDDRHVSTHLGQKNVIESNLISPSKACLETDLKKEWSTAVELWGMITSLSHVR